MNKKLLIVGLGLSAAYAGCVPHPAYGTYHFADFRARHPIHVLRSGDTTPRGISPDIIKTVYHLPQKGGRGTIAIIDAYESASIEQDLNTFNSTFGLPACTTANKCFKKHAMAKKIKSDAGWNLETSLDVEWAHAIAPDATVLLVEAATPSGANLMKAVDYATSRADVVAISMSWGGGEFAEEQSLDTHFTSPSGATFFASSGDNGWGASWPASSPYVTAVGGTSLTFKRDGSYASEQAWSGSGGGVSAYEPEPAYQKAYVIPHASSMRAIPDVAYNADPHSGFSVYAKGTWYVLGGTSAGAPQWAAIHALGRSAMNEKMYADKAGAGHAAFFRDVTSGSNGNCSYYCDARKHYDYVTGLGTPLTANF